MVFIYSFFLYAETLFYVLKVILLASIIFFVFFFSFLFVVCLAPTALRSVYVGTSFLKREYFLIGVCFSLTSCFVSSDVC